MKKSNILKIKGRREVEREIRARYSKGLIEPLEKLGIEEGKEIVVTIKETLPKEKDAFERSAGAWKGTLDAEKLIRDIYSNRSIKSRAKVSL